jgi:hypothetical protein
MGLLSGCGGANTPAPACVDHAPRIIPLLVVPSQQNGNSVGVGGCPLSGPGTLVAPDFHIYVEDDDVADSVFSAWKATSLSDSAPMRTSGWLAGTTAPPSSTSKRSTQIGPPSDANAFFASLPFSSAGTIVRIDVLISDGSFLLSEPLSENFVRTCPVDGGDVELPAQTDSFTWTVNVVECPP